MKKATMAVASIALLTVLLAQMMLVDSGKANPYDLPVDTSITIYNPNYKQYESGTVTLNIKVILVYGQYDESWAVHLESICYSLDGKPLVYMRNFAVANYIDYGRDKQDFLQYTAIVKLENLSEGSHIVKAYANDTHDASAYINDRSASYNFIVDLQSQAPHVEVLSPVNQVLLPFSKVSLVFTANGAVNWMGYSLDGGENITVTGNLTLSGLSSNVHTVIIYANDTFGNAEKSDTITFTLDRPEVKPEETSQTPLRFEGIFVAGITAAIISIALLVYFKKRKH